jgi:hypothetical protein
MDTEGLPVPLPALVTNNKVGNWFRRREAFLPYVTRNLAFALAC